MSVRRVVDSLWYDQVHSIPACVLPWNARQFAERWEVAFSAFEEDGLGLCLWATLLIDDCLCAAEVHPEGPEAVRNVALIFPGTCADTRRDLEIVLRVLGLEESELPWVSDQLGPARWRLYRLDDNGNEFPMEYLHSNASAEYLRKKYEDKGHKQLYFIRPIFDSPDSPQRKQDASP